VIGDITRENLAIDHFLARGRKTGHLANLQETKADPAADRNRPIFSYKLRQNATYPFGHASAATVARRAGLLDGYRQTADQARDFIQMFGIVLSDGVRQSYNAFIIAEIGELDRKRRERWN
jgi:hypothetical protein